MLTFAFDSTGAIISVQDVYAFKERGEKPPACFCPSCNRALIAKLGVKVTHHFAHQPHPHPCFGSTGEGELHISAKAFLQRQLQALAGTGGMLLLESTCERCECLLQTSAFTLQPGDLIQVETWGDPRKTLKPDLTVVREKEHIGFIEVLVTHACEPQKIAALKALKVPLVEARGKDVLERHRLHDNALQIPVARVLGIDISSLCPACTETERQMKVEQERRDAEWKRLQQLPATEVVAHCYVHFFLGNGVRFLKILVLERDWENEAWVSARLTESPTGKELGVWGVEVAADLAVLMEHARQCARKHCRPKTSRPIHIETYGGFQHGSPNHKEPFPVRWWDPKASRWIRVQFERGLAHKLGVREETVERQIAEGKFRRIEVKPFAAAQKTLTALEAEGVERFAQWLARKRASEQRTFPPRR